MHEFHLLAYIFPPIAKTAAFTNVFCNHFEATAECVLIYHQVNSSLERRNQPRAKQSDGPN